MNGSYRRRGWLWGTPHPSTSPPPQTPNVIVELQVVVQPGGGVSVALSQGGHLRWGDVRRTRETPVELGGGGRRGRNITIPYPLVNKPSHTLRVQRSFTVMIFRVALFGVQADMNTGWLFIVRGLTPLIYHFSNSRGSQEGLSCGFLPLPH